MADPAVQTLPGIDSWAAAATALRHDPAVRLALTERLRADPEPAFCFETRPCTRATAAKTPFEFVVVPSPALARVPPEPDTFRAHFRPGADTAIFPNLGGSAILVAPSAHDLPPTAGTHLAAFLRAAPLPRIHDLWQHVGLAVEQWWAESSRSLWVSTAGLGVYWLHVRLDRAPKYYRYAPFKTAKG